MQHNSCTKLYIHISENICTFRKPETVLLPIQSIAYTPKPHAVSCSAKCKYLPLETQDQVHRNTLTSCWTFLKKIMMGRS